MREFRECFPEYSLSIIPGDSPVAPQHVIDGTVDLALMIRPERPQRQVAFHVLFEDELYFMVSPLHPWAKANKVDRAHLGDQQMVLYGRGSATARMVERYFIKMQAPLRDYIELGDIEARSRSWSSWVWASASLPIGWLGRKSTRIARFAATARRKA